MLITKKMMGKVKDQRKKTLKLIPYFFTFANVFFGFLSIVYALEENFIAAAYCIFFAALMDGFDGRLARLFKTESFFGMELDSLCDAISFCLAPAVLLYSSYLYDGGFVGVFVLGFYLCAGLFRLAKFNLTSKNQTISFLGLPTTVAAFFLAALVLYHDGVALSPLKFLVGPKSLRALIVFVAALMISSIPFPSFKHKQHLRIDRRSLAFFFVKLGLGLILAVVTLAQKIPLLFMALLVYIIAGAFMGALLWTTSWIHSRSE